MKAKQTKMKQNQKPKAILHGECLISETTIPADAVVEDLKDAFVIVANSETTGNHHVIDRPAGVTFLKAGAKRYMSNTVPTDVRCVIADRHDNITIPPGQWEIGAQEEFDYFAQAKRAVQD